MSNKVARSYRLSPETLRMIDEIVERFSSPLSQVTATQVIEEAVRRLYDEIFRPKVGDDE